MGLTLRNTLGCTEVVISDEGGLKKFYQVAGILTDNFKVSFTNKEDDFDAIDWQFKFKGHQMTLHYSIYNGTSLFPTKAHEAVSKDNVAVVALANLVGDKLLSL